MKLRPLPKDGEEVFISLRDALDGSQAFDLMTSLRYDPQLRHLTRRVPIAMEESDDDVFFLSRLHHQRLRYGAKLLGWDVHVSHTQMVLKMTEAVAGSEEPKRVRVTVDRSGEISCITTDVPERDNLFSGLSVTPAKDGSDPYFEVVVDRQRVPPEVTNMVKTTQRDFYNAARKRAGIDSAPSPREVLIIGTDGTVLEGSTTSVAFKRDGGDEWITPRISRGGMVGVMRSFLLELGYVREGDINLADLHDGDDVLLFNGVQGVCAGKLSLRPDAAPLTTD